MVYFQFGDVKKSPFVQRPTVKIDISKGYQGSPHPTAKIDLVELNKLLDQSRVAKS